MKSFKLFKNINFIDDIFQSFNFIQFLDQYIIVCNYHSDNFLLIVDINTSTIKKAQSGNFSIEYFVVSSKRKEIACKSEDILIFDLDGNIRDVIKYNSYIETLAYDNSEENLFIFYQDLTLKIYNLNKKEFIYSVNFNFLKYDQYSSYFINFDKKNDFMLFKLSNEIEIILKEGYHKTIDTISSWVELSKDKKYLATINSDISEDINIYDTKTWEYIKTISGMEEENKYVGYYDNCNSICFSPKGNYLVGIYIGAIKVFNFFTSELVYENRNANSQNVSFSDDGKYICFIDKDGLKIFEFGFP